MGTVESHKFSRKELESLLDDCIEKTLAEVDVKHVLATAKKNKGYAGAVIEQSVLGYPADSAQRPDLIVDGSIPTELKTTGIKSSKNSGSVYEAKEPVSVTAVSPETIAKENFENSKFWEKTAHMLFVFYLYSHKASSPVEYADFPIKGYEFTDFDGDDKVRLQRDWTIVHDFIQMLQERYPNEVESHYPEISSVINSRLSVIDTAPKWPNRPRFRLKRSFVDVIVQEWYKKSLGRKSNYEKLPGRYLGYQEIDSKCHELSKMYKGKTVRELFDILGIKKANGPTKQDAERIVVKMFGGEASSMSKIDVFSKIGLVGRSFVLTRSRKGTEDTKLFPIDFDELQDVNMPFEESSFAANFIDQQILFVIFSEPSHDAAFSENVFEGFKRFHFDDDFIQSQVKSVWDTMRNLIFKQELKNVQKIGKNGKPIKNKNGIIQEASNWPKAKDGNVFVRGTGADSSSRNKPICINGVRMYRQNIWVRRVYLVEALKTIEYL
ncbi:MutH/Sau3AI family endonuclease [Bifidobacterium sp. ESL0728]|uniref:MutH/Sau3AI family endonuclease n=1 Tax=Bifidobacterium sp. ESL0728 TaxID=2983220 RepID=UPI0023F94289|nr:MutH/Sau3AI family endonuclease [Bifidobacterium sp. ESL0728]WEV58656.1 MutH/Sau3AI family endonuclease [Bifidobacterium sp. ESL0728]